MSFVICHFFTQAKFLEIKIYTEKRQFFAIYTKICTEKRHSLPIFRVKSVKIYTDQKNLHGYARGACDKYQVWVYSLPPFLIIFSANICNFEGYPRKIKYFL